MYLFYMCKAPDDLKQQMNQRIKSISSVLDYRLNPVLRKACKADIPKFCQNILNKARDDNELEGQVISCLKLKYADQVRTCDRCECDESAAKQQCSI